MGSIVDIASSTAHRLDRKKMMASKLPAGLQGVVAFERLTG
jgi:hypothetical protein